VPGVRRHGAAGCAADLVYLADLALTDRPPTIGRKLAAIAVAHRDAGLESPTEHGMVKRTLAGIRREKGTAPQQKAALLVDELRRMVASLGASPLDRRDRAIMLLGFGRRCGEASWWRCASKT